MPTRALLLTLLLANPIAGRAEDLILLLHQRNCPGCHLEDVDLVHADLRDADLQRAQLQRANLGQARLDGADLRKSNLQFTNLRGASLRGADLRDSTLYGTDLRQADLSGAQLDDGALDQAHWQGAQGINKGVRSHAALHNAGVTAAENSDWERAEALFGAAIAAKPEEPLSWIARGLCRGELGNTTDASRDLSHAGTLFAAQGDQEKAQQLLEASSKTTARLGKHTAEGGNGIGSRLLSGAISTFQALAPIALRAFSPILQ
tara:strand:+ start:570 stop:1355 length:786 start_codon:yes stop_codon:yes gene_type:complete